jgi:tetratricopeptide (TPR) repeat protein/predicted Ser/Thr protein kinase
MPPSSTPGSASSWAAAAPSAARIPVSIVPGAVLGGRYEILAVLGEGGMGAVYKAHDREVDRDVAIKVIRPELAESREALERFRRELILARKITHPSVVRIFDLGVADGVRFITMEFIDGEDLSHILARRQFLPPREAAGIILQVSRALEVAHAQGVIHRDLKPQNIMIERSGRAAVMDFGIAHEAAPTADQPSSTPRDATLTRVGSLVGTPRYMAPEQFRAPRSDARSDLFSVGVIFYELLTGRIPFAGDTPIDACLSRMRQPSPQANLGHEIPKRVVEIVTKCLAGDPAVRYQSAHQLTTDLESWLAAKPGASFKWLPAAAAAVILIAAAALLFVFRPWVHRPASAVLKSATVIAPVGVSPNPTPTPAPNPPIATTLAATPVPAPISVATVHKPPAPVEDSLQRELKNAAHSRTTGDPDTALTAYKTILARHPNSAEASAGAALALHDLDRDDEAARYFRDALANIDAVPVGDRHLTRGTNFLLVHDGHSAETELLQVPAQNDPELLANLAQAHSQAGDVNGALDSARRAWAAAPDDKRLKNRLARYELYSGDFTGARHDTSELTNANPAWAPALITAAWVRLGQGGMEDAETAYQRASPMDNAASFPAALGLADLALFEGRFSEATRVLTPLVSDSATPTKSAALAMAMLAEAAQAKGDSAEAERWADRAVQSGHSESVLVPAARVLVHLHRPGKALHAASMLDALPAPSPRAFAQIVRAELKMEQSQFPAAVELLQNAEQIAPTWLAEYDLGRIGLQQGRAEMADKVLRRLVELRGKGQLANLFLDDSPVFRYLPPADYYLGRAREQYKPAAQVEFYKLFLKYKARSESDPMVDDARRRTNQR